MPGKFFLKRWRERVVSSRFSVQFETTIYRLSPSIFWHKRHLQSETVFPDIFRIGHHITQPRRVSMSLAIGDTAPDFEADTTEGKIRFHDWIGNNWVVLFSHPKDFTPVCTTELGTMARLKPEFDKRGVKIIGLSVDPVANHEKWSGDIKDVTGLAPNYPMIGDTELKVSKLYGMLPAATAGTSEGRSPNDN